MSPIRCCALVALGFAVLGSPAWAQDKKEPAEPSVERLSERELLPSAPTKKQKPWRPIDSLEDVPEVCLEEKFNECQPKEVADKHIEATLAKIRRLERKRPTGFVDAIKKHRPDLAGLPFIVGKEAEMNPTLCKHFFEASRALSDFANPSARGSTLGIGSGFPAPQPVSLISRKSVSMFESDRSQFSDRPVVKSKDEFIAGALLAKQRLAPLNAEGRMALTQILQATPLAEVNVLLAQIAIFAPEPDIREAAIQSLKVRRDEDYGRVFVEALDYPLPSVANNAADAIIKLELRSLLPKIAAALDDLDGQVPHKTDKGLEVREVVKINHSRNCMLCHSPAEAKFKELQNSISLTAPVPNPLRPLPAPAPTSYYGSTEPERAIRFDVTYLRPDFSLTLPAGSAYSQWPENQRFDFLVRTRILAADEAAAFEAARRFLPRSPNREAALRVLRELTGQDAGSSSEAWIGVVVPLMGARSRFIPTRA